MFDPHILNVSRVAVALASLAAGSTGLTAQNRQFFPSDHATVEGSSTSTGLPFALGVSRVQLIYGNFDLQMPDGAMITKVGVRPDGTRDSTGVAVQLEVWMGHTSTPIGQISTAFARNFDDPPIEVVERRVFTLPNVTAPGNGGPSNDVILVPLDTPFRFDASKSLVVDYRVYANANSNNPFNYGIDVAGFFSDTDTFGASCATSAQTMPSHVAGPAQLGGTWSMSVNDGLNNGIASLVLGTNNTDHMGLPLPFPLDAIGAAGCFLNVEAVVNLPARADTQGRIRQTLRLPKLRELYGTRFYTQYALADPFANSAGLVTTNGGSATMGLSPQMTIVFARDNANARSGTRQVERGLVSVIEYN